MRSLTWGQMCLTLPLGFLSYLDELLAISEGFFLKKPIYLESMKRFEVNSL